MIRWEYTVLSIQIPVRVDDLVEEINAIGSQGWELVSSTITRSSILLCTFKRPRLEGTP